jgi:hypothetical protein
MGLGEAMLFVKQERILGIAPLASSVSLVSSHLHPRMHVPYQVHAASRFATDAETVQFNGAQFPTLIGCEKRFRYPGP